jgi:metallophosphoesterase (TIGR00282 family)
MNTFKVLIFGDVVGRIGRGAMAKIVPQWKKKYKPDLVIANAENIAHGKGVTPKTLREVRDSGVDFFTSGNHIFDNKAGLEVFSDPEFQNIIVRPANYPTDVPGEGFKIIEIGTKKVLIVNLNGQVGFRESFDSPFLSIDKILGKRGNKDLISIIDFHTETTSEKVAFGHYVDGRISAVIGTHTHVPTADAKILPKGTGYISDVGMVGEENSVLGVKKEVILNNFLTQIPQVHAYAESGPCEVNAVYLEIDSRSKKTVKINLLQKIVNVP